MDAPKRQRILETVLARLQRITVENGRLTNAGERVYLGESPELGPDDPINAIAVMVQDTDVKFQGMNIYEVMPIEIQALARADIEAPYVSAEAVLGDIVAAIEQEDRTMGGLVLRQIELGTTRVVPREAGMTTVGVGITYFCPFVRAWGQP